MPPRPYSRYRLLALFPHPDDEAYSAGGTLALCAQGGAQVQVVCATRGEQGDDRRRPHLSESECARVRTQELHASCHTLGVLPPIFLDFPDGHLQAIGGEILAQRLQQVLRQQRPHVLITLGEDGVYGHRDHLALTQAVQHAASTYPLPLRVLQTVFPPGVFHSVWRALSRLAPSPVGPAPALGFGSDVADIIVDVSAVRDRKRQAIAAHRSQLENGDPETFLRPGLISTLLDTERFLVAAGLALPAQAQDIFTGL